MYKQGWKIPTNDFQEMYREVRRYALSLYPDVTIPHNCYISNRMGGKTFGRYSFTWHFEYGRYGARMLKITDDAIIFSSLILQTNKKSQLNTIIHEIAHCVANKHYQYDCKHDHNWETIGNKIGQAFNEKVSVHVQDKESVLLMVAKSKGANPYRYQLVCEKCGKVCAKYKNMPRAHWMHSEDKGNLIVERITF